MTNRLGRVVALLLTILSMTPNAQAQRQAQSGPIAALILIQPGVAGPNINPDAYVYTKWIRWPLRLFPTSSGLNSDLISLTSGIDWFGVSLPRRFRTSLPGPYRALDAQDLTLAGYFGPRDQQLRQIPTVAVPKQNGGVADTALVLGIQDPEGEITVAPFNGPWPTGSLIIHEASSWDDVAASVRKVSGRTLVVEYPPPATQPWTRFWTLGHGWPDGIPELEAEPTPGLIPARDAVRLLLDPNGFRWRSDDLGVWDGANRWLKLGHTVWPLEMAGFGVLAAIVAIAGVISVFRELRSPIAAIAIQAILISPACLVAAGALARRTGVGTFWLWMPFLIAAALGLISLLGWVQRRLLPEAHPLLSTAALGAFVLTFADARWSPLGACFAWIPSETASSAIGCLFGYWVGLSAFLFGASVSLEWAIRFFLLAAAAMAALGWLWWAPQPLPYAALPVLAILFGDGTWRWPMSIALPMLGFLSRPSRPIAFAWNPAGQIRRAEDLGKIDLSAYLTFLFSPLMIVVVALCLAVSLLGNRFFAHQLKRLLSEDPRRLTPLASAGALALVGLGEPTLLPSALWCALGGFFVLLYDGVTTL